MIFDRGNFPDPPGLVKSREAGRPANPSRSDFKVVAGQSRSAAAGFRGQSVNIAVDRGRVITLSVLRPSDGQAVTGIFQLPLRQLQRELHALDAFRRDCLAATMEHFPPEGDLAPQGVRNCPGLRCRAPRAGPVWRDKLISIGMLLHRGLMDAESANGPPEKPGIPPMHHG